MNNNNNSEFNWLKRFLSARSEMDPDFSKTEVNKILQSVGEEAFDLLDDQQQKQINIQTEKLTKNINGLGKLGALEVLAAIGNVITEER